MSGMTILTMDEAMERANKTKLLYNDMCHAFINDGYTVQSLPVPVSGSGVMEDRIFTRGNEIIRAFYKYQGNIYMSIEGFGRYGNTTSKD